MTREYAIEKLELLRQKVDEETYRALILAIKALEQMPEVTSTMQTGQFVYVKEPCDDAISRDAAINIASLHCLTVDETVKALEQLPPVTQKPGKWIVGRIFPTKVGDENLIEYRCSECDRAIRCTESQLVNYPYCHCGAKMKGEG